MRGARTPWWLWLMAFVFGFAYALNLWHDVMGPEALGYESLGHERGTSLRVGKVAPDHPFSNAGGREGDVLIAMNDELLESGLDRTIVEMRIGLRQPFTIDVQRGAERLRLNCVLLR